jgi:hypothetical protein
MELLGSIAPRELLLGLRVRHLRRIFFYKNDKIVLTFLVQLVQTRRSLSTPNCIQNL